MTQQTRVPGYEKLEQALRAAYDQASAGKGKERHAVGDTPFEDQPMSVINRQLGSIDGFIYQAHKKSLESKRLPLERAQAELLGAINYLAGAWIELERQRALALRAAIESAPHDDLPTIPDADSLPAGAVREADGRVRLAPGTLIEAQAT